MVNYHRIGTVDTKNPFHRLHTVPANVFDQHVKVMLQVGRVVSLDDVRSFQNLGAVNFVISFDDVPQAALTGIQRLLGAGLPLTIAPCSGLATLGMGTRDKVYAIEKYLAEEVLTEAMQAWRRAHEGAKASVDPATEPWDAKFYFFTKGAGRDPALLLDGLIDPLFDQVKDQVLPYRDQPAYLTWDQIRDLAAHNLVTVANHGHRHDNLVGRSRAAVHADIAQAHQLLEQHLGQQPRYFAVPFGRYDQRLASDAVPLLARRGYHGLLWVGDVGAVVRGPYEHQMLQLTRLHAPVTGPEFEAAVAEHMAGAVQAAVWQVLARDHARPTIVTATSDPQRALPLEMILRQGKDYSSSPRFYDYQFTSNPSKSDRDDVYAAQTDGYTEALAYNFHTTFTLDGVRVPGVYLSGWRRLPRAHRSAAGLLVRRMIQREAIVGVQAPNPDIVAAFASWKRIPTWALTLPALGPSEQLAHRPWRPQQDPMGEGGRDGYAVTVTDSFPSTIEDLCAELNAAAGFTVARGAAYYSWRHDAYPLAACRYVLLGRAQEPPAAYAVVHPGPARVSIADWYATERSLYWHLLAAIQHLARSQGAHDVELTTSDEKLAQDLVTKSGAAASRQNNYYHLNAARLAGLGLPDAQQQWRDFSFHESGTTGDVLIRPGGDLRVHRS